MLSPALTRDEVLPVSGMAAEALAELFRTVPHEEAAKGLAQIREAL